MKRWLREQNIISRFFEDDALTSFSSVTEKTLLPKERDNLYKIIGALLYALNNEAKLNLNTEFAKQSDIVNYIEKNFGEYGGLKHSNLEKVFAEANKLLELKEL